jgi:very-short-patch-repair endonuclease
MARIVSVVSKLRRDRARRLRQHQTEAETQLWDMLRAGRLEGWKWRRQAPVGLFIVDFLCLEAALVVERDGGIHAREVAWKILAAWRESDLGRRGDRILRGRRWQHPQGVTGSHRGAGGTSQPPSPGLSHKAPPLGEGTHE